MQKEVDQQAQLSIEGSPSAGVPASVPAPGGPYVNRPPRPPRPPPPKFSSSQQQLPAVTPGAAAEAGRYQGGRSISAPVVGLPHDPQPGAGSAGEQWTCSLCTFQNHELMTRCEVCSLPKMPGRLSSQSSLPAGSSSSSPSSVAAAAAVAAAPASASLLVAASAPVATAVVLQTSAAAASIGSPSSSATSSTASTPQTQPTPPPIQNAQFQKSSIEC